MCLSFEFTGVSAPIKSWTFFTLILSYPLILRIYIYINEMSSTVDTTTLYNVNYFNYITIIIHNYSKKTVPIYGTVHYYLF